VTLTCDKTRLAFFAFTLSKKVAASGKVAYDDVSLFICVTDTSTETAFLVNKKKTSLLPEYIPPGFAVIVTL
jgi:hypothetical protein